MSDREELPEGWEWVRLDRVHPPERPIAYGVLKPGEIHAGGVPMLRVKDINKNRVDARDAIRISPDLDQEFRRTRLRGGELLVSIQGTVGRVAVVPADLEGANVSRTLAVIGVRNEICAEWIQATLLSPQGQASMLGRLTGTTRDSLNIGDLREVEVPLPPLVEQRRIVAKLDALRARSRRAKEALDAVPALLDRLRQSILAAAFRGDLTADWREANPDVEPASELLKRIRVERRTRWEEAELAKMVAKGKPPKDDRWKSKYVEPEPVDESDLPELPEGWCWASGTEVFAFVTSGSRGWAEHYSESGAAFLRVGNTTRLTTDLSLDDLQRVQPPAGSEGARTLAHARDLVVSITADIGRVAVLPEGLGEAYVSQHLALVRLTRPELADLVAYWMISPRGQQLLARADRGMTKAGLGLDDVRVIAVPLPPQHEAELLVSRIGAGLAQTRLAGGLDELREEVTALDASTLRAAFSGELLDRQSG